MIRIKQQQMPDLMHVIRKISDFINTIKIILVIGVVCIVFHKLWEEIISNCIVDKILPYFEDNVVNQVIFVAIVIGFIALAVRDIVEKKERSNCVVVTSILVIGMWAYYRFWSDVWSYVNLGKSCICYIDVILVVAVCVIINRIYFVFHDQKRKIDENKGFSLDLPITEESQDVLGRKDLARRLAEKIYNTKTEDGSYSVGIVSPWGNGKTSFIKLVHNNLVKHKEIIWMEFNPWKYEKNVSLIEAFFIQLAKNVRPYNDLLAINLLDYAHVLTSSSNPLIALTSKIIEGHTGVEQKFSRISDAIKKIGKQIIVVIDDLDRLDGDEILSVLKLIRNIANFPNMVFISAYDRKYLVESLKCNKICKSDIYLEKIFQYELPLPIVNQEAIICLIEEEGKKVIRGENDLKEFENILTITHILGSAFCVDVFTNLRDVYRFINGFSLMYKGLQHDIIIRDLMNLELLQLKYLDIYDLFATNYELYLARTPKSPNYVLWDEKMKTESNDRRDFILKKVEHKDIKEVIKKEYEDEDQKRIIMILTSMFNGSHSESGFSIGDPDIIRRYFEYALLPTDVPKDEFEKVMNQPYEEVKKKIDEWSVNKAASLSHLFAHCDFKDNQEKYRKLMRSIFYLGEISETHNSVYEIKSIIQRSPIKDQEEHKNFILQVFNENSPSKFVVKFIRDIMNDNRYSWHFIVSKEDCLEVCCEMFKKACEENEKMETIDLFLYYTREIEYERKEGGTLERKEKLNEKAIAFFNDYALKNPEKVFSGYIQGAIDFKNKGKYKIGDLLYDDVWDSNRENFNAYVAGLPEDNAVIKEFKDFYKTYQKKNYEPIPYEFKSIKLDY